MRLQSAPERLPEHSMSPARAAARKPAVKKQAAKPAAKPGALPEWNLADLYPAIDGREVGRDLAKAEAECVAF